MQAPLAGVKVLDLTRFLTGPYCTMLLGDMGAEVIKIEPLRGDDARRFGLASEGSDSKYFIALNRNKKSVVVDLNRGEGLELVRRLSCRCDVLVENFRPGVAEKMGLDYDTISGINPGIIYCSNSAFGSSGPYKDKPGFDIIMQGVSGIIEAQRADDRPLTYVKRLPASDLGAAMLAAYGIALALLVREKTGVGQKVETSLFQTMMALQTTRFIWMEDESRRGLLRASLACYDVYEAADGKHVVISCLNDEHWERLCRALDAPWLVQDQRFRTHHGRYDNGPELKTILEEVFLQRTAHEWVERFDREEVPGGPVMDMEDLFEHPQIKDNRLLVEMHHPVAGRIRMMDVALKLSKTPGGAREPGPLLGQHTREVLAANGLSDEEIYRLVQSGVVRLQEMSYGTTRSG